MTQERHPAYFEIGVAPVASTIPAHVFNPSGFRKTPNLDYVFGEMGREDGYIGHIGDPRPPIDVCGIKAKDLRAFEKEIVAASKNEVEVYTRRGKTHSRIQRNTTPIVLAAVASWPEPDMFPNPERERWVRRIVRMFKRRFGRDLVSIVAHDDEAFYHLHILAKNGNGKSVKPLMAIHSHVEDLLLAKPNATRKEQGEAAREGGRVLQKWYSSWAGVPFGHYPKPQPRDRTSRTVALRERQLAIERAEDDLAAKKKQAADLLRERMEQIEAADQDLVRRAKAAQDEILHQAAMIKEALDRLHKREAKVNAIRAAVLDQAAIENAIRQNRYEPPGIF